MPAIDFINKMPQIGVKRVANNLTSPTKTMVLTATTVATIDVVTTNFISDEDLTERDCVRSRSRSFAHKKIS